ncbi:lysosomal cobalamin transport escort protein LMBD1 [Dunckerocampus dactyliophorus]|uniref:lysosomal cobalamin transport escort protein LMBD1 n=1 Tax=Dunckerocampus dactyliophorus TaxID=161453 RepID=UPI002406EB4F|nr:lysosomal cobalamin transport escort protein LMBD1 [Dunckerocampus dactyliophorus]XP_054654015.1 lysosomal cobalamin transport escort protein LMBD1 [Dunckerocampus dactyliophorus]
MAAQSFLSESALGWSIFTFILLVILSFCWVYIRKFQSRQESEVVSTITAICALAIALITSALLPVDIFLVSFMKYPNGTYKEWAANNETRAQIEDTVLYGYYTLYSIILFCVFLWIPFVYFYYEERDDDNVNTCSQVRNALKYTVGFAIVCLVLLLIGAFVPLEAPPQQNATQWEKVQYLFEELGSGHGLTALAFSISSLTLIGMLAVITYTAYGMSVLPLNLIKGTRSVAYERLENTEDIDDIEHQIEKLKSKCKDGRPLSSRDRNNLQELEGKLQVLRRRGRHLEIAERNCCNKVASALRPFKIILGIFFILIALLFTVALFISNLDKALHSAGISSGFIIFGTNLTNPLNELLLALQPVFPLDYILITVITMYFVLTSMAGIRNMGIWFFWIRLYKIRPKRTRPQALLFLCMILLLIVLHTSYMIYSLAPQYVMYGSQKYLVQSPSSGLMSGNASFGTTRVCDADAPEDQCIVTRSYIFLHKFWFFSTIYYFGNWAFIGVFLIGLVVSCCRGKKSVIEGEVEADDSDVSDDEYVH